MPCGSPRRAKKETKKPKTVAQSVLDFHGLSVAHYRQVTASFQKKIVFFWKASRSILDLIRRLRIEYQAIEREVS